MAYRPTANLAIIFVQHLLADRKKASCPTLLSTKTPWPVVEAAQDTTVAPRHIYVIPPNVTLEIAEGRLELTPRAPDHGHIICRWTTCSARSRNTCRKRPSRSFCPAPDRTARWASAKSARRRHRDCPISRHRADHDGMPRAAIATDGVDLVLPPLQIGPELARLASHGFTRHIAPLEREGDAVSIEEEQLRKIFAVLRRDHNVDFKYYKTPTIRRRLARRMTLQKIQHVADYLKFLEQNPAEVQHLHQTC